MDTTPPPLEAAPDPVSAPVSVPVAVKVKKPRKVKVVEIPITPPPVQRQEAVVPEPPAKKKRTFRWTEKNRAAFDKCREALVKYREGKKASFIAPDSTPAASK